MLVLTGAMLGARKAKQTLLFAGLAMAFGSSALLVGAVGRVWGRIQVFRTVVFTPPDERAQLLDVGSEEADAPLLLGGGAGLPLLLLGSAAMGLTLARRGAKS
jgi:hypothetical protein